MDFDPPESVRPLLEQIEQFVADVVMPAEHEVLERGFVASAPLLAELRAQVQGRRAVGRRSCRRSSAAWPRARRARRWSRELLGRSPLGHYVFGCQAPDAGNMEILHKYGTRRAEGALARAARARRDPQVLLDDRAREPGLEPDDAVVHARVSDGDDYVIDGHKWFTTAADGAAFAIVMAVTNPDAPPHARAPMIIVPTDTPGFELVRNIPIMGDAGDGWAATPRSATAACRVPSTNRLGAEGAGFLIAQERLGPGRIHHCMRWIGICERAFDMMCRARHAPQDRRRASRSATRQIVAGLDRRGARRDRRRRA